MRSRAIVFASVVLLLAPLTLSVHPHCGRHHHSHRHGPPAPPQPPIVAPETPLDALAR